MTNDAMTLHSAEAAQIRVNTAMKSLSSTIEGGLVSGLTDITIGTKSASQGFRDMGLMAVRALDEMIMKMMVVGPLMRGLQGMFGLNPIAPGGTVPDAVGPTSVGGAPLVNSAHGNMFSGGNVIPFASGGVVDSPTIAPMALFGEAGPEAIIPLRRGPDGNLGVGGVGGGGGTINAPVTINIDAAGADPAGLARVQQQLASMQATLPATIVMTVKKAKTNRVL
jgi:lambda family phage tail tape measure protein